MELEIKEKINNKYNVVYDDEKTHYDSDEHIDKEEIDILEGIESNLSREMLLRNPILLDYAKKYKPDQLTADGIPTIETQLKEMDVKDEEMNSMMEESKEKIFKREMVQRVKCLSLMKMGKSILTNTFEMKIKDKKILQELMWDYNDIDTKDIIKEFNTKIGDYLDDITEVDYSKLPIYEFSKNS